MLFIINKEIDDSLRAARRDSIAAGSLPGFSPDTKEIREAQWRVQRQAPDDFGGAACLAGVQSAREAEAWLAGRGATAAESGVVLWLDSIWAAFEVDEIIFSLKDVVIKVVCDADGYLCSLIETFHAFPEYVLPDRADITPSTHLLRSFTRLAGSACQRRGVAIDGVVPGDPVDGGRVEAADLLLVPKGRITERGIRQNIRVALAYLTDGEPAEHREDDARLRALSEARLAAAQLWQWVTHDTGVLDEGRIVTAELFKTLLNEESGTAGSDDGGAVATLADTVLGESFTMHAFRDQPGGRR